MKADRGIYPPTLMDIVWAYDAFTWSRISHRYVLDFCCLANSGGKPLLVMHNVGKYLMAKIKQIMASRYFLISKRGLFRLSRYNKIKYKYLGYGINNKFLNFFLL